MNARAPDLRRLSRVTPSGRDYSIRIFSLRSAAGREPDRAGGEVPRDGPAHPLGASATLHHRARTPARRSTGDTPRGRPADCRAPADAPAASPSISRARRGRQLQVSSRGLDDSAEHRSPALGASTRGDSTQSLVAARRATGLGTTARAGRKRRPDRHRDETEEQASPSVGDGTSSRRSRWRGRRIAGPGADRRASGVFARALVNASCFSGARRPGARDAAVLLAPSQAGLIDIRSRQNGGRVSPGRT